MPEKPSAAGIRCSCEICLLHPHLKEALNRMQPPELRLYSHADLMELLQRDISTADDANKLRCLTTLNLELRRQEQNLAKAVLLRLSWGCGRRKEFIHSLALYLACRVRRLWSNQRRCTECCPSARSEAACGHPGDGCCSKRVLPQPVRMLECGAGTGLLAAHLLPLLRRLLQENKHISGSSLSHAQHAVEQQSALDEQVAQQSACQKNDVIDASRQKRALITGDAAVTKYKRSAATDMQVSAPDSVEPTFKYMASEPRRTLQWCAREVGATVDGCRSIMRQFCPQLVICCWMPFNVDWTQAARASCCACCKEGGGNAGNGLHHLGRACQVQEYILIGHAEGGLVGRPFETWGLNCPQENILCLGVDFEDPQEEPTFLENSLTQPHTQAAVSAAAKAGKQLPEISGNTVTQDHSDGAGVAQWRPQNTFTSIPPMREEEFTSLAIDANDTSEVASDQTDAASQFAGMDLLPLKSRPYHQDGFTRLPPLPGYEKRETSNEAPEEEKCLEVLLSIQQLSRFDSLHSLLKGCPSKSRVVVFRRTLKEDRLEAP
ncbi:hypothetical protein ACSSS7_003786 [Eimeria intestinalis]